MDAAKKALVEYLRGLSPPTVNPIEETPNGKLKLSQAEIDRRVWEEEGEVIIPDINDPRVRAEVKRKAAEQERRLEERLIAAGLHVLQRKDVA